MSNRIEIELARLGLQLPAPASPRANYVPFALSGPLVFTAGR